MLRAVIGDGLRIDGMACIVVIVFICYGKSDSYCAVRTPEGIARLALPAVISHGCQMKKCSWPPAGWAERRIDRTAEKSGLFCESSGLATETLLYAAWT
jgi:hypothetical protein